MVGGFSVIEGRVEFFSMTVLRVSVIGFALEVVWVALSSSLLKLSGYQHPML